MGRLRVALAVLHGEMTAAEAARGAKVREQGKRNWKHQILEAAMNATVALAA